MAAKYWIKLYHEILRDRKMVKLDDHLYRRVIEVFLMAGENDKDGYLPSLDDMAFELRITNEELETDLNELIRVGILEVRDGYYFVAKFKERQGTMTKAEYMHRRREGEKLLQYDQPRYQSVTNSNSETDTDTDKIRIDTDAEADTQFARLLQAFTKASGLMAGNGRLWVDPIFEFIKKGYTEDDITRAVQFNNDNGYQLTSPNSIINTITGPRKTPTKKSNSEQSVENIERFFSHDK